MLHMPNTPSHWSVQSRSKVSGSPSGYGKILSTQSLPGTTKPPQMKRPRSKIANGKKPPSAQTKASTGNPGCSVPFKAVPVAEMKGRKTSTGSSTLKCKSFDGVHELRAIA